MIRLLRILLILLACSATAVVAEPLFQFDTPQQEQRFQNLTAELRCLVCQNQSLADSHADLAGDLRQEIYRMLREQKSDREIIDFLVQRYGDFVLYRPRLDSKTLALWFGPALLLLLGIAALIWKIRRRSQVSLPDLSAEQQHRIASLLQGNSADEQR